MELRQIEYFVALAEELHFGRTAARLFISQPALSKQIQTLEQEMNLALFERTQRRVGLTAAGLAFLGQARHVMDNVAAAQLAAISAASGQTGILNLSFTDSLLYNVLPDKIRQFREDFPAVSLLLHEADPLQQIEGVQQGAIDAGMLYPPIPPALCSQVIHEDPIVVALPERYSLAQQPEIDLADLNQIPFIGHPVENAPQLHAHTQKELHSFGFYPNIVQEVASKQTMISLVAAGIGVALLPSSFQRLVRSGVVYRPLVQKMSLTTVLVWDPSNANPALRNFLHLFESL